MSLNNVETLEPFFCLTRKLCVNFLHYQKQLCLLGKCKYPLNFENLPPTILPRLQNWMSTLDIVQSRFACKLFVGGNWVFIGWKRKQEVKVELVFWLNGFWSLLEIFQKCLQIDFCGRLRSAWKVLIELKHFCWIFQWDMRIDFHEFEQTFNTVSTEKTFFQVKRAFVIIVKVMNQRLRCRRCLSDYWFLCILFFLGRNTIINLFQFHLTCLVFLLLGNYCWESRRKCPLRIS